MTSYFQNNTSALFSECHVCSIKNDMYHMYLDMAVVSSIRWIRPVPIHWIWLEDWHDGCNITSRCSQHFWSPWLSALASTCVKDLFQFVLSRHLTFIDPVNWQFVHLTYIKRDLPVAISLIYTIHLTPSICWPAWSTYRICSIALFSGKHVLI